MSLLYFKPFTDWIKSKFLAKFTGPHNHIYLSVNWNSLHPCNTGIHFLQYTRVLYNLLALSKKVIRLLACSLPLFCSLRNTHVFLSYKLAYIVIYELPDVQAGFRKGRETRDQRANIHWIIKKAIEFQKNICFIGYAKAFDCVDHNKLWKILKDMGLPDHLTCLLRNLCRLRSNS